MPRKPKWSTPLEKDVQRVIIDLFKHAGFKVRSTSQYRASHVDPDMPDLYCTYPERGLWFWFEVKRLQGFGWDPNFPQVGKPELLRQGQAEFRVTCLQTGQPHYWGAIHEAEEALIDLELGHRKGSVFYHGPTPLDARYATMDAIEIQRALSASNREVLDHFGGSSPWSAAIAEMSPESVEVLQRRLRNKEPKR